MTHSPRRVVIMGAAGRDFHNFNVVFRDDPAYTVVAFTAAQIPNIEGRRYPAELAGELYPAGIPIRAEDELAEIIRRERVDEVVFAYSDVTHQYVMNRASSALAEGADFRLLGPAATMLRAQVPVVAITAVRTGAGKSQTTRRVAEILTGRGLRVVVVRHPMPYGRLAEQRVQRFASAADLELHDCTIEEREEYEPHLERGNVVYAGIDYAAILERAEAEADVLLWDGGNNDFAFYRPDLQITVVDPHRAGHETAYHPGETNLRSADVVVINKVDTAAAADVAAVRATVERVNPRATIIEAASPVTLERADLIAGKSVVVIEDGPTLTHGEMGFGAGTIAARQHGGVLVDPRPHAVGSLRDVFARHPHLAELVPAMGYGGEQMRELEATINATPAEIAIIGTPIDLGQLLRLNKPVLRVRYELAEQGDITLADLLETLVSARGITG
jgi:predicted GTPase